MSAAIELTEAALGQLGVEIERPKYDRASLKAGIVHLGFGGFHRAHLARYIHQLLEQDFANFAHWGIIGAGLLPFDRRMYESLKPQDFLYTLIEKEGSKERVQVIGSVVDIIFAAESTEALVGRIADESIKIVSLTITENGYCLNPDTKQLDMKHTDIVHDLNNPTSPKTAVGVIVESYARRRAQGALAFTSLSCDNIQHNGKLLREAVLTFATARDPLLAEWIASNATFPNSMVDRITPITTPKDIESLATTHHIADRWPVVCESFTQFVIEDQFASGRPALEAVGVQFVPDVTPYEVMKLRLLNGSHLAIATLADLSGYTYIDELMRDDLFARYMRALMDRETGQTLLPVAGVDLDDYKATLIARFSNVAIKDTVERVAIDAPLNTILATIRDLLAADKPLELCALCVAAWLRRIRGGENDKGRKIVIRHPLAELLMSTAEQGGHDPLPLLSIQSIFGDLATEPKVVEPVRRYLKSIYENGAFSTLQRAAQDLDF